MQQTNSNAKSWLWVLALILVLVSGPKTASAGGPTPGQMQSGSLLLRMEHGYSSATLLNTEVSMKISGLVARVTVKQQFRNNSPNWVEGIYVFPLPDRAAVDRMRLHIGERFIEGEIQEKDHARKTYENAKQAGKKASLVEQQRANLFMTSVANVAPGELVVIEIEYLEDIRFDDGSFSIRFPMTLTPRYISGDVADASRITPPQVRSSTGQRISLSASVHTGVPLEIIASRYHPVNVAEENGRYTVTLSGDDIAMDHDFELVWRPVRSVAPRAMVFMERVAGKSYYLLMVLPPDQEQVVRASMAREMIFIVDTSGSMHGVSIAQAKRAMQLALEGLKANDLFNVIEFNSTTNALYPYSMPASTSNVREAADFVRRLKANGGTEMRPALAWALGSRPSQSHLRQIVFITDGSVGYEDELFSMIEQRLGNARLFTVGIGSAPNSWFMRKAAEAGRGSYTFISALHEVSEKMGRLFRKLEHPQVTNIEVQWPSGVVVDSFPSTIPDLYLGEPVSVRVRVSGDFRPGAVVHISGNSISGAWSTQIPVDAVMASEGIAALWARARIGELMDVERRHDDADGSRSAIIATALEHHLVSKYTSMVAVDKTPVRASGDPLQSEQIPNLMPYGQSGNVIVGFPATATNGPLLLFRGVACLLAALALFALQWGRGWFRHVRAH